MLVLQHCRGSRQAEGAVGKAALLPPLLLLLAAAQAGAAVPWCGHLLWQQHNKHNKRQSHRLCGLDSVEQMNEESHDHTSSYLLPSD